MLKNIKSIFYIIGISLLILCKNQNNDKNFELNKWNEQVDGNFVNRKYMVDSLIKNKLRIGMKKEEVMELFNISVNCEINNLLAFCFEIKVDYGWNIDPQSGKTLYLILDSDNKLIKIEMIEWKRN
ncbi:hypothetical protein [Leptospira sp. GIMC2001]|uniref:hypothetical protein n=1 Tax=Leptospira sp. GIMC2001 TaxID=1513297 RepID=UPI0023492050|nr:hypothetical protein [Leptospira sp. GIMC2001]WCL50708.1 hypothetical protein O4O04_07830 [Leptospira sp. GIMC2001]